MPFNIFVKGLDGKTYNIEDITPETTVKQIKDKVHLKSGIDPDSQTLVFAGKPFGQDDTSLQLTVADYGIQKNSTLMLAIRLKGGSTLELLIKITESEEIKIDISNTNTVKQLKEAIYAKK
jgi:hypothetical protein